MNEESLQLQIDELKTKMATHRHNGSDMSEILSRNTFCVTQNLFNGDANVQANYNSFWIAPFNCIIKSIDFWYVENSSPDTLTITLRKQASTESGTSGTSICTFTTGDTGPIVKNGTLTVTSIAAEEKIGWSLSATTTTFPTCGITVTLQKV